MAADGHGSLPFAGDICALTRWAVGGAYALNDDLTAFLQLGGTLLQAALADKGR